MLPPARLFPCRLLHFLAGAVSVARDDVVLQRLVLLVLHAQRVPFVVDQFDAQLAIGAVLLGVGGMVDELVLRADVLVDVARRSRASRRQKRGKKDIPPVIFAKVFISLSACR